MGEAEEIVFNVLNNGVGEIVLNRPRALNALTLDMIRKMTSTLKAWENDPGIKMIIIKGEGGRAFCSGGDVKSIAKAKGEKFQTDFIEEEYKLDYLISCLETPYLSVWDGIVMGGGVGISRMGHVRIATERTVFAMPECGIGLIPDIGSGFILRQLPGQLGVFLGLTGTRVTGWMCHQVGLATHYIRSEDVNLVLDKVMKLTEVSLLNINKCIADHQVQIPLEMDADYLTNNLNELNEAFKAATYSEVVKHLKQNKTKFSEQTLDKLNRGSPTSLLITFYQLSQSKSPSSYKEALEIEYRLMSKRFLEPDFYEGVRAALIDKDNKPNWIPSDVEQLDDKSIEKYFMKTSCDINL